MPIGPITPGTPVTVTPDADPIAKYVSVQAPTASMPVVGADIQALTQVALNIQQAVTQHERLNNVRVNLAVQTTQRTQRNSPTIGIDGFTSLPTWQMDSAAQMLQLTLTAEARIFYPLDMPDGATLGTVRAVLIGHSGHTTVTPSGTFGPPSLTFFAKTVDGTSATDGSTFVIDAPASIAAYQARHNLDLSVDLLSLTGTDTVDNSKFLYYAMVSGERGSDAVAGLRCIGVITFNGVTSVDPGK